jgi:hypothetical protein
VLTGIIAGILYFSFDPASHAFFPKCPFYSLTGWQCPGCGSQRALHSLLHLELSLAFSANPLMVVFLPYIALGFVFEHNRTLRMSSMRKYIFGKPAIMIILGLIVLFFVSRNIL